MLCLDLTEMDQTLLRYVDYWTGIFDETEEVILFHNIKHSFPRELQEMLDQLDRPLRDFVNEDIEEKVQEFLPDPDYKIKIEIKEEDSTAHAIAQAAAHHDVDLTIVGKKVHYRGTGIVPSKLLRLSESSVLFLPETAFLSIKKVLVPTDFSSSSMKALHAAFYIHEKSEASLECQHVYHIPARYFPYVPLKNIDDSLVNHAQKRYQKFLEKTERKELSEVDCTFTPEKDRSIVQSVYNFATQNYKDLIVIGHRGKTMFVGSVATGLSNMDMHIPLLIIKS